MYNRRYIIPGILFFLAAFTFPFWANLITPRYARPVVELPKNEKDCVEPVAFMRGEHMRLLNDWRDAALREGKRSYIATSGKVWEISLQNTCMKCHNDKEKFCDSCHTSNSVAPYCWDCHLPPQKQTAAARTGGKQQ